MNRKSSRRSLIKKLTAGTLALGSTFPASAWLSEDEEDSPIKGNINHSVCYWTYNFLPLDQLCRVVRKIGFNAIDLLAPKEWPTVQAAGIHCSMCYTAGRISLTEGWNDTKNHQWLIKDYLEAIPLVSKAGYRNLICFSGNKNGMDDETGLKNSVAGLKQILSEAERNKVVIQIEIFNSKVDHKGYMADNTAWAVELCKRLGSPNFKILYDIYHMQVNEGDVIRTIRDNHQYFGHYHTAGVPGRHEINQTQELYYPAIMRAIKDTGFEGYVAQEFIPTGKLPEQKLNALKDAIKTCDI